MAIQVNKKNEGKVLEVQISGTLVHDDYVHFVPLFEGLVKQHGNIRVLFEMVDFHGWTLGALWDDTKLDVRHFSDIDRLAMVGDKTWEKAMSVFCRPFTKASIRYFERSAIDDARRWLESD